MQEIKKILDNQQEVKYLTYFISQDERTGRVDLELGAVDIVKKYSFASENACLNKLIEILLDLKRLESWSLKRNKGK